MKIKALKGGTQTIYVPKIGLRLNFKLFVYLNQVPPEGKEVSVLKTWSLECPQTLQRGSERSARAWKNRLGAPAWAYLKSVWKKTVILAFSRRKGPFLYLIKRKGSFLQLFDRKGSFLHVLKEGVILVFFGRKGSILHLFERKASFLHLFERQGSFLHLFERKAPLLQSKV